MGGSAGKTFRYGDTDALEIAKDIGCEKTQSAEALAGNNGIACGIMHALVFIPVLRAVNLDDQSLTITDEIQHVSAKRRLAAEMEAVNTERAEINPKQTLGQGCIAPQRAGAGNFFAFCLHQ